MTDRNLLAPWVRRFLLEHLVAERNFARCTQMSYRDALALLLPFVSRRCGVPVDRLSIDELSPLQYDASWTMSNKRGIAVSPRAISGSAPSTPLRASSVPEHRNICLGVRKCGLFPSRRL